MYRYFSILLCFLGWQTMHAQSLTPLLYGSGGQFTATNQIQWSYSLGEPVVGHLEGPSLQWLQGFQQPLEGAVALPVEWLSFELTADGPQRNYLKWEVLHLGDSDIFEVERSLDGFSYESLTEIDGTGEAGTTAQYDFIDEHFPAAQIYYRIRQIDLDGEVTLSPVRTIDRRKENTHQVLLLPNPATDIVRIEVDPALENSQLQLNIYQADTRLVWTGAIQKNKPEISIGHLSAGIYWYEISGADWKVRGKLMKKN